MTKFQMCLLLISACLCVSGCSVTSSQINSANQQAIRLVETEVVGSDDERKFFQTSVDSNIATPDDSMTLAEVLSTPDVQAKFGIGTFNKLVVVVSEGPVSKIIPMELIAKGFGKYVVAANSSVEILPFDHWSKKHPIYAITSATDGTLSPNFSGPAEFVLSGLVETKGKLTVPATGSGVNEDYYLGVIARKRGLKDLKPNVAVVNRIRRGRVLKHFVPLTPEGNGDFEKHFVQDGDSVQITKTELLPEVIAGKAAERLRSRLAAESQNVANGSPFRIFRR